MAQVSKHYFYRHKKTALRQLRLFRNLCEMAEWTGLEPATPCVTGRYSNQLNYHSAVVMRYEKIRERI